MSDWFTQDREGPEHIPEHEVKRVVPERYTCFGCKFYREHMTCHRFMGPNDYVYDCEHPEAYEEEELRGHFPTRQIATSGGFGHDDTTPNWCPFLRGKDEPETGS